VTVRATAGEIVAEESFVLKNEGSHYSGISLRRDQRVSTV
jgi:hypothetical protein